MIEILNSIRCRLIEHVFNMSNTRLKHTFKLYLSAFRTNKGKFFFLIELLKTSLPQQVVSNDTVNTFKIRLDRH